jgi:hypothetical protein
MSEDDLRMRCETLTQVGEVRRAGGCGHGRMLARGGPRGEIGHSVTIAATVRGENRAKASGAPPASSAPADCSAEAAALLGRFTTIH